MTSTANSSNPSRSPAGSGAGGTAVDVSDIQRAIAGSSDNVAVSELSRQGFKQVKVLRQAVITKLITEAVDRAISSLSKKMGGQERERIIQESRVHFEKLAKERVQKERDRISELEVANQSLLKENEQLRKKVQEGGGGGGEGLVPERFAEALLKKLQGSVGGGGDLSGLQKSIQQIANRLDRMPAGGGGGSGGGFGVVGPGDEQAMVDALFRMAETDAPDSNMQKVKVKEAKAGGVKDTLAKLKSMQKGGKDGD